MANPLLGAVFKSPMIEQIFVWQVLQQITGALLAPVVAEIEQTSFGQFPSLASSPVELAAGLVRGHIDPSRAREEAKKSGYDKEPFQLLVDNAGQPLPLQALLEAWRRNLIPKAGEGAGSVSLEQGIRESDLKNKWIATVEALQFQLANPGVVIEGWLRAQLDEAPARELLRQNGIDEATATLMYKAAGRPPSPGELLELEHRGLIPLKGRGGDTLSVEQGFLETDLKNKWFDVWTHLGEYLPPPRTITAMLREGAFTDAEAAELFKKQGLTPDLVRAYLEAATHQKTATSKELAKSDVLAGYADGFIPAPQAIALLGKLKYSAEEAQFELDITDFRAAKALMAGAITRIRTLYVNRKLAPSTAQDALSKLGLSPAGISRQFAVWDIERQNLVQRLTAAEWVDAVKQGLISEDQCLAQLQALGFTPFEAWVRLALHLKGQVTSSAPPADVPAAYTQTR